MTTYNINYKLDKLVELESIIAELKENCETIKKELISEMERQNTDQLITDRYVARWTACLSSRFDTKRFKSELGEDLYHAYTKEVASHRWSVSA